jgi:hypothetical protein
LLLVPVRSARGPAYIVVELMDGRRRSLRRSVTDLAGMAEATPSVVPAASRISARTLLPLARHLATSLAASAVEVRYADHAPSVVEPTAHGVTAVAAVAKPAGRDASAGCPAAGRPAASAAPELPGDGECAC